MSREMYTLFTDDPKSRHPRQLAVAQRMENTKSPAYLMSIDLVMHCVLFTPDFFILCIICTLCLQTDLTKIRDHRSGKVLGKLKSNFKRNEYILYDKYSPLPVKWHLWEIAHLYFQWQRV